jgi:hypothetical protein
MRFIITAQPGENSKPPTTDGPIDAEVLKAHMRLNPGGPGARIEVTRGKRAVVDGPFAESKELVGGFYIVEVKSLDEAVSWALRCPTGLGFADVLEIRPLTGPSDLPAEIVEMIKTAAPTWSASFMKPR